MEFKSLKQLEAFLTKKVAEAMKDTVAPSVKKMQSENVDEFVYSTYDPTVYERRGNDGGLSDVRNMSDTVTVNGNEVELSVENNTMSNRDYLPYTKSPHEIASDVEYGQNYDYPTDDAFTQPRRFIQETRNELEYGKAKKLMAEGLKKKGLKVE